jgi:hypothetical protein
MIVHKLKCSATRIGVATLMAGLALLGSFQDASARDHSGYRWSAATGSTVPIQEDRAEKVLQLIRVTSDAVDGSSDLKLIVDVDLKVLSLELTTDNKGKRHDVRKLIEGIVLISEGGRDVVVIKSQNFDPVSGGDIDVIYLHNGINGTYRSFPTQVIRTGDRWAIYTNDSSGRKSFTQMYLKAKRALGRVVGIDYITVK